MATNALIDEIVIDVQATVWKFDMARGWEGYSMTEEKMIDRWDEPISYCMTLVGDPRPGKSRTLACFYDAEDSSSIVQDIADDNGGASAELVLPWEVFCRCVDRLATAKGSVQIPGRNGQFKLDEDGDVIYTTACRQYFRLSRAALEALAR